MRLRPSSLFGSILWILCSASIAGASTYEIVSKGSRVRFAVGHHDYAKPVHGKFGRVSGKIEWETGTARTLSVEAAIDADSIDTANEYRDSHLRTSFFGTDDYPEIRFRLPDGRLEGSSVDGQLTIRGITKPVRLELAGIRESVDAEGRKVVRCRVEARINRRDFDVIEHSGETSGLTSILAYIQEGLDGFIEDEVEIKISITAREVDDEGYAGLE